MKKLIWLHHLSLWCHSLAFCCHPFSYMNRSCDGCATKKPYQSLSATLNNDRNATPDNDSWNYNTTWEHLMKQLATEALVPVLYPPNTNGKPALDNLRNTPSGTIDAERALKKLLGKYQKLTSTSNTTLEERQASRKMLADLVIGTSVMRLFHYHSLVSTTQSDYHGLSIHDIEPIYGVTKDYNYNIIDTCHEKRLKVVGAMVDMHSKYIKNQSNAPDIQNSPIPCAFRFNTSAERISTLYSLPLFFVEMLIDQYGEHLTEQMTKVFNEPGPITIRRNRIKCSSDEFLTTRLFQENNISTERLFDGCIRLLVNDLWSPSKTSLWSLQSWKDGWFEIQDSGSQLIVKATEANVNDRIVVDYCAGNGGKTLALASELYRNDHSDESMAIRNTSDTLIIAHDIVEERMRQLKGSLERVGLGKDAIDTCNVTIKTTLDKDISLCEGMADLVLVDAPCSSSGVLRRRPSQRFLLDKHEMQHDFPKLQSSILKEASRLVKVGGKLVYSTCSISHFENEDVVKNFERSCHEFGDNWQRWQFHDEESPTYSHFKTLLPNMHGSDGFFIARWKRIR